MLSLTHTHLLSRLLITNVTVWKSPESWMVYCAYSKCPSDLFSHIYFLSFFCVPSGAPAMDKEFANLLIRGTFLIHPKNWRYYRKWIFRSVHRSVRRSRLVGRTFSEPFGLSELHNYLKGWEVSLPCSYRSTCQLILLN